MNARWQDTPVAVFLRVMADLMIVNIVAIICSFPLLTIGASLSAMYSVLFQRERDEGMVAVLRTFFLAFKRNFLKATALELIVAFVFSVAAVDFAFAAELQPMTQDLYKFVGTIIALLGLTLFVLAFAQQSIFDNTIVGYVKNSFKLALCAPWQLLVCLAAWIVPWGLAFGDVEILTKFGFFLMLWGFSFPTWVTVKLFRKVFRKTGQADAEI